MIEIVTDAIVLDKEYNGDSNVRVHLFTKESGRMVARATSVRKITSKLGAHLEPLTVSTVRFVQKNHLPQLVDALRREKLPHDYLPLVRLIQRCTSEYEQDLFLWHLISRAPNISLTNDRTVMMCSVLTRLGYDPQFATCSQCEKSPVYFFLDVLLFACETCLLGAGEYVRL